MNNNERLYELIKHAENSYVGFILETEVALEYLEYLTEKGYMFEYTGASVAYLEKLEEHFDKLVVEVCDNEVFIFSYNGNGFYFFNYDMLVVQEEIISEDELSEINNDYIVLVEIDGDSDITLDCIDIEEDRLRYLESSARIIADIVKEHGLGVKTHEKIFNFLENAYEIGFTDAMNEPVICGDSFGKGFELGYDEALAEVKNAISELV